MSVFPVKTDTFARNALKEKTSIRNVREEVRRQQVVTFILFIIFVFQLINLPGAIMMQSMMSIGTVILGIALCGIAMMFNRQGKVTIVSILLIGIVDLGCGLMLLMGPMGFMPSMNAMPTTTNPSSMSHMATPTNTSSMNQMGTPSNTSSMSHMDSMSGTPKMASGLDVSDLPVFDVLVVSDLIAVSLLPAVSIFYVATSNILFILGMIAFSPRTPELEMLLHSGMAYNAIAQPISLQIVVAAIAYIWVSSALRAAARADRAEEIAALQQQKAILQQREVEQKRQLDLGTAELLQALVQAANGQVTHISLQQDHILWKIGNSVNLLLTKQRRAQQIEQESQQLRLQNIKLMERLHASQLAKQPGNQDRSQKHSSPNNQAPYQGPSSWSGLNGENTSFKDV